MSLLFLIFWGFATPLVFGLLHGLHQAFLVHCLFWFCRPSTSYLSYNIAMTYAFLSLAWDSTSIASERMSGENRCQRDKVKDIKMQ